MEGACSQETAIAFSSLENDQRLSSRVLQREGTKTPDTEPAIKNKLHYHDK
jgi:hypothetical protein